MKERCRYRKLSFISLRLSVRRELLFVSWRFFMYDYEGRSSEYCQEKDRRPMRVPHPVWNEGL